MVVVPSLVDLKVHLVHFHSDDPLAYPAHLLQKLLDLRKLSIPQILYIVPSIHLMDPIHGIIFVFDIPALFSL